MEREIRCGDALEVLAGMADESVHCCVTSRLNTDSVKFFAPEIEPFTSGDVFVREGFVLNNSDGAVGVYEIPMSDYLRSVLRPFGLQGTEGKNCCSGFQFDLEVWEYSREYKLCFLIGSLITEQWFPPIRMRLLSVIGTTKRIYEEANSSFVCHTHLDSCMVSRCFSTLALICLRFLNTDISLAINDSSDIRNIYLSHHAPLCVAT